METTWQRQHRGLRESWLGGDIRLGRGRQAACRVVWTARPPGTGCELQQPWHLGENLPAFLQLVTSLGVKFTISARGN